MIKAIQLHFLNYNFYNNTQLSCMLWIHLLKCLITIDLIFNKKKQRNKLIGLLEYYGIIQA